MRRTTPQDNPHPVESYTVGGLLAYAAVIPLFVALLAAPGLTLAFTLGIAATVLLNRTLGRF